MSDQTGEIKLRRWMLLLTLVPANPITIVPIRPGEPIRLANAAERSKFDPPNCIPKRETVWEQQC